MRKLKTFLAHDQGATAIEYGLIAGLIAVSLIIGLGIYYDAMIKMFEYIVTTVNTALGL
ncbi:Flp family type IVb pilin [Rhizobium paknamense]|uniref:Pilus assembly protein Flp/PilA n=1 Tax=Rhizobium paknamense TaxID=1206817 RepID=A0ABU0IH02_9HYPH|nr:Flp family type IVb pilin [Rhizobium paknamense]MDQ0456516.1 pilus assembly protein Flp/PilA [Rhizobium paknamense]